MSKRKKSSPVTGFREWLGCLESVRDQRPLWPVLLGQALNHEFIRQRDSVDSYAGSTFKDRDNHPLGDGEREERLVARLYRAAQAGDGCVELCGERIWLIGFQWPTQGAAAEKSRRADLVGLTAEGGLVVFEAKVATGTPPLHALCEGLDYLACLLRPVNYSKIEVGFHAWAQKPGKIIPEGFKTTRPLRTTKPKLVILAPESYFTERYARSIRGREWPFLVEAGISLIPSIDLHFAATDFKSTELWEPKPHKVK
jgi:hypothetical protein